MGKYADPVVNDINAKNVVLFKGELLEKVNAKPGLKLNPTAQSNHG